MGLLANSKVISKFFEKDNYGIKSKITTTHNLEANAVIERI
jgi:hypothetical protein